MDIGLKPHMIQTEINALHMIQTEIKFSMKTPTSEMDEAVRTFKTKRNDTSRIIKPSSR